MASPDTYKRHSPEIEMNVPPEGLRRETEGAASEQLPVMNDEDEQREAAPAVPEAQEPVAAEPTEQDFVSDSNMLAEIGQGHVENIEGDSKVILDNYIRSLRDEEAENKS